MGYRRMRKRDLWEIYRRWQAGQSLLRIAGNERRDRKTVRAYLAGFSEVGLSRDGLGVDEQQFYAKVSPLLAAKTRRQGRAEGELLRHEEEVRQLICRGEEPLKPKTAFVVVKTKYELTVSYATFKRFVRERKLSQRPSRPMIRIELPPGLETQLDYGRVGTLADPITSRRRTVWAFCGVLSHSRLPYVQFVHSQDQGSFASSTVLMLEYYGGKTEFVSIDNLKSGVIKPDLWDPQLNRAFAEVADYYGFFIDPCRVRRATDKGKVERFVPVARELFRMLKALHPSADLAELNRRALDWCRQDYGAREHGTTGIPPMEAFAVERQALKPLPEERFKVPIWKNVSVHGGDQFFSFSGKRFALPPRWKGHKVWARYASPLMQVYDGELLIRQYVVNQQQRVYWTTEDFPAEVRTMMDGGYPAWLLRQAQPYGQAAVALLASVLQPHAYLNARRARGMLSVMEAHRGQPYFEEVCRRATRRSVTLPQTLKRMFEAERSRPAFQQGLPVSAQGSRMVRDIDYYLN
jgi:transposase